MRPYQTRFLYEHPALITEDALPVFAKNVEVHQLAMCLVGACDVII
jgi:hypothetical protein